MINNFTFTLIMANLTICVLWLAFITRADENITIF